MYINTEKTPHPTMTATHITVMAVDWVSKQKLCHQGQAQSEQGQIKKHFMGGRLYGTQLCQASKTDNLGDK